MSQQGGRPTRREDDWWGQLYDDSTDDAGPTATADSLDDRFASAADTVDPRPGTARGDGPSDAAPAVESTVPPQCAPTAPREGPPRQRGSWKPTPEAPEGPATFPPGPKPPGFRESPDRTPGPAPGRAGSTESAPRGGASAASAGEAEAGRVARAPSAGGDTSRWGGSAEPADRGAAHRDASGRSVGETPTRDSPPPQAAEGTVRRDAAAEFTDRDAAVREASARSGGELAGRRDVPAPAPFTGEDTSGRSAGRDVPAPRAEAGASQWGASGEAVGPGDDVRPEPVVATPARQGPRAATQLDLPVVPPAAATVDYVGSGPPTYDAEPTALPVADPDELDDLVADTVLDGARYGACTLRAVSVRGDSARYRGEPRRDSLLTARFGSGEQALILVALATGARATPGAHRAASEACQWLGRAVGRSHQRLGEDIRAARRGDLKSGLHRLTDRSLGKLRASAAEQGIDPEEYSATLRCLLLPAHPECRTRVFFGIGEGGLFRLRNGEWQDIEPRVTAADTTGEAVVGFGSPPSETPEGDRLTMDLGIPTPPSPYEPAPEPPREPFRFRASVARPGDALLMCSGGLADPLRGEPALCAYLARRWSGGTPPGLAAFLADTQVRVKGYADDRTVAAVWEA
ncbi:protein phosphatase 2C domain-containing protein [Streptomyces herbicida]|uniref:protein phosphatase 2C domain-containing protein n=1 Tax=Streptomyces herbicida TaxID=3065675 RepID=UPI002930918A|nr:protein phosphatase 2C domain-containing protein [Streptomyces sp. NEAU-HV9]